MLNTAAQRNRFTETANATASPQTLLVMLYDRLLLDLQRAETSTRAGDPMGANRSLQHAQDIVIALVSALDVDAWSGGPTLKALYSWLLTQLVQANVTKDLARMAACRGVVEPLRDAWKQAAAMLATASVDAGRPMATLGGTA